jgi:NAD-dependent deacetylase
MPPIHITKGTRVFVLTGAGISAESGLRTFRDANGLWEDHRVEDVASPGGWRADPLLVWRFYSERRAQAGTVKPNSAHRALVLLESHLGDNFFLCTQNVDPLHEAAGSKRLVHMHGQLNMSRCENPHCRHPPFMDDNAYRTLDSVPRCLCGARIRPHIVWFGEEPLEMGTISRWVRTCHLFITVGSSGAVYPAAGLVREIRHRKSMGEDCRAIYIGIEAPLNADEFDEIRLGKAGDILPSLFDLTPTVR